MNREAEKIDFEYATAYLQAKDITGSVSAVFADGFSYIESNGAHFVDWESVQKLGMNHLDNLIHDAPKKVLKIQCSVKLCKMTWNESRGVRAGTTGSIIY